MTSLRKPIIRFAPLVQRSWEVTQPGDTEGAYSMLDIRVAPGAGPQPHVHHAHDESFFVIEGQMSIQIEDQVMVADVGTFVLIPKGTVHAHSSPGPEPNHLIALFSPGTMEGFMPALTALRRAGLPDDSPESQALQLRFDTAPSDSKRLF